MRRRLAISPLHALSTTHTMLSTRAGANDSFSAWRSMSMSRSALSIAAGVVPSAAQRVSETPGMATRSDGPPLLAVDQEIVGLRGPLRARLVLRDRPRRLRPLLHDRVADAPLGLDLVVAGEQRGVAAHRVGDE